MTGFRDKSRHAAALALPFGLFLTCLIAGCAAEQQPAELPPPAQTSTTAEPTSHARMDAVCQQPGGSRSKLCEAYRYSSFGGNP